MALEQRQIDEQNTQRRAEVLRLEYFDSSSPDKRLYKDILTLEQLYKLRVIPVVADDHNIMFGITNTTSQQTMTDLKNQFLDQKVKFVLISDTGYREYMQLYDPPKKVQYHDISITDSDSKAQVAKVSEMLGQVRADDMLAYLVSQAHGLGSSDIHIETQRDNVRIRLRIDGVLHEVAKLEFDKYRVLMSAVASAANISTAANDAQQGHISQRVAMADGNQVDVNLRLETVPTVNGMDMVMRLFNMDQSMYNLDRLGLSAPQRKIVDDIISKPSGLVMMVGPTGSGKTTTLYSVLNSLNNEERKIITIEDPVEYQFAGIVQIPLTGDQVAAGGFAERLKAILRLDPDIVMVGEIRDGDTAKTALQAALTGHLVLSTFHASSSAAALTRLAEIIGENPLFVSAIRLIMAQRLVRRLDDSTKQSYDPDPKTMVWLQQVVASLPAGTEHPPLETLKLYKPGSSAENPFGFKGQIALREQFTMTGKVGELMTNGHNLTTQQIESAAVASGMRTMLQDGVLHVLNGETTLEELFRVVG
jgi:type II secretory ATPase GspE/PulE/Tfp pilus assembly ATPase PilB-like protein